MSADSAPARPHIVVFDLGNVLIRWDPRNLYRKIFPGDDARMERFLDQICTMDWNEQQDAGRSWADAVGLLQARHPAHHAEIEVYDTRWEEMLGGVIEGTAQILEELKSRGTPLYALTNWSSEKFPVGARQMPFLQLFDAIVVSGDVGLKKPDPAIFRHLLETHMFAASDAVFIDDSAKNIETAASLGFHTVHFEGPEPLRRALEALGLLGE